MFCIKGLCWTYVYFFAFATFSYVNYVIWDAAEIFIYFEFCFQVFKGTGFSIYNYITYFNHLFLPLFFLCFNSISTFFRLFNAKAILLEER